MKKWFPVILLVFIIIVAAFLRIYRISDYMEFLGDEGRDAIVARGILHGEFTLLGPRSSAGDFYMGPFYYYLITPFLLFSNFDPVGPAIMVAIFGVATVWLIYWVGKKMLNEKAGFIAAGLYSVSPLVLAYSHSSWNPDILPFFSLLFMYAVYISSKHPGSLKFFFLIGFLLGICLQLHYLSLFLACIAAVYIFVEDYLQKKKVNILNVIKKYLMIIAGSSVSLLPFFVFELRHDFLNTRGIFTFLFGSSVSYSADSNFFVTAGQVFFRIFGRLVFNFPAFDKLDGFPQYILFLWGAIIVICAILSIVLLYYHKDKKARNLLLLWILLGVILFGFYKKEVFDYLFTFIFTLPFLLIGNLFSFFFRSRKKKTVYYMAGFIILIALIGVNLWTNPFRYEPNRMRNQTKEIASFVISKSENKPYNFALLSAGNADYAYRYYLDILGHNPKVIENMQDDPSRKTVTQQLFVVCEDINCKPLGNSLWEVAGFGRAEIVNEWQVSVVKVYKLIPYKE